MIILDTPPLFSEYFSVTSLPESDRTRRSKNKSQTAGSANEYHVLMNAAYIISWLQIVAHQIIIVSEPDQVLHPLVVEAIRLADLLLPKQEFKIRHKPELIFVENKVTRNPESDSLSIVKKGLISNFSGLHYKINTAESRLYPTGKQTSQLISDNDNLMAYESIEMPQSTDINFISISNWNEYLNLIKEDHENLTKIVNPNAWSETGIKPVCHRIDAKNKLQERLYNNSHDNNLNDSTENPPNKIDSSYFELDKKINKKFLPNPSIGINNLKKICSSCPRVPLFGKSHINQAGKQINVKPTEKDWMGYAQKIWEDLLNSSFYSEFRYFEFNDYS